MATADNAVSKSHKVLNLMVIGSDRQARNTFIQSISEEETPPGRRFMNFGKIQKGCYRINLYGVPGDRHFASLWKAFAPRVNGMILIGSGNSPQDVDNLRFALSTLQNQVDGPVIFINTDPANSRTSLDQSDIRTFTCFPADRTRAPEIVDNLLKEIKTLT